MLKFIILRKLKLSIANLLRIIFLSLCIINWLIFLSVLTDFRNFFYSQFKFCTWSKLLCIFSSFVLQNVRVKRDKKNFDTKLQSMLEWEFSLQITLTEFVENDCSISWKLYSKSVSQLNWNNFGLLLKLIDRKFQQQ